MVLPWMSGGWLSELASSHVIHPCGFVFMSWFLVFTGLAGMTRDDEISMRPTVSAMIFPLSSGASRGGRSGGSMLELINPFGEDIKHLFESVELGL